MSDFKPEFNKLPAVDKLLNHIKIKQLIEEFNPELVKYCIRNVVNNYRNEIKKGIKAPNEQQVIDTIVAETNKIGKHNFKRVINTTGVIVHTNLGRAPFGQNLLNQVNNILKGYNNLEFDLEKGKRGHRDIHIKNILRFLTGAEDALVVNNNAAAVMFILRTFAKNKDVIISRGELIEIGGSFRIPEIMAASDCKMVEVGATNKTKLIDYEKNINENTALIFKTHKSNYVIKGFTKEVELEELVELGKKHKIPVVYDIGSGLLRKVDNKALKDEPDVKQALSSGTDLICFSGDKLLGGPQAGIIAGKRKYIEKLRKEPLMRALRVGKTTLSLLETSCINYLNDKDLFKNNLIFNILSRTNQEKLNTAKKLQNLLDKNKIKTEIIETYGQYGGGTLPDKKISSYAIKILFSDKKNSEKAELLHKNLLLTETPILSILRKGEIMFDILTIFSNDTKELSQIISKTYKKV